MSSSALLVIHPGTLGDVLLSLTAVRALRAESPGREVGMVTGFQVGRLLMECREVDRLFPLESTALGELFVGPEAVSDSFREWVRRSQIAVCWLEDKDGTMRRTLKALGAGRVLARSPMATGLTAIHQSDRFAETIAGTTSSIHDGVALRLPSHLVEDGRRLVHNRVGNDSVPLVVLHPGSGSHHKCAQPSLFVELIEDLHRQGIQPVLLAGPTDHRMIGEVRRACPCSVVFTDLDLCEVAGLFVQADLVVSHDSGIAHLAAALGIPTLSFFGPTAPSRWAPRGSHVNILTGPPCHCADWQSVQHCIEKPCLQIPMEHIREAYLSLLKNRMSGTNAETAALL